VTISALLDLDQCLEEYRSLAIARLHESDRQSIRAKA